MALFEGYERRVDKINAVLADLGKDGIEALIKKHMGLE